MLVLAVADPPTAILPVADVLTEIDVDEIAEPVMDMSPAADAV